jgi:hypothetical protein
MKHDDSQTTSRREFLKAGAVISTGAALTTLLPATAAVEPEESAGKPKSKGYQLTQHVLDYYKTARF